MSVVPVVLPVQTVPYQPQSVNPLWKSALTVPFCASRRLWFSAHNAEVNVLLTPAAPPQSIEFVERWSRVAADVHRGIAGPDTSGSSDGSAAHGCPSSPAIVLLADQHDDLPASTATRTAVAHADQQSPVAEALGSGARNVRQLNGFASDESKAAFAYGNS